MPHFAARFSSFPFVLHDVKHGAAGIYDGKRWYILPAGQAEIELADEEEGFVRLWKLYYRTVSIPSRKNERLMKNYMPVRYWKFMPERESNAR